MTAQINLNAQATIQQTIQQVKASRKQMEELIRREQDIMIRLARCSVDFEKSAMVGVGIMMLVNFALFVSMSWFYIHDIGFTHEVNIVMPLFFSAVFGCLFCETYKNWKKAKDELYLIYLRN